MFQQIFKQILDGPQSDFSLRMYNYITKRAELSLQIRIVKSTSFIISTSGQAILVTQKQSQLILREPKHTKTLLHVSFDMGFTTMLRTIYKHVIVVGYSSLPLNVKKETHSVPVSPHVKKQVGLDLCSLPEVDSYRHVIVCVVVRKRTLKKRLGPSREKPLW